MSSIYDLMIGGPSLPWLKRINHMNRFLNPTYMGLSAMTKNLDYVSSAFNGLQKTHAYFQGIQKAVQSISLLSHNTQLFPNMLQQEALLQRRIGVNENNIFNSVHYGINHIGHPFALNDLNKINSLLSDYSDPFDSISYFHSVYDSAFGFEGVYSEKYIELYKCIPASSEIIFKNKTVRDSEQLYVRNENGERYPLSQQKDVVGGYQLFHDIEEKDIVSFISFLSSNPYMALEHPIGRKIAGNIKKFKRQLISKIDAQSVFYRSKTIGENASPFLLAELFNPAPSKYMKQGRFNHGRRPCLYVSDNLITAKAELKDEGNFTIGRARIKKEMQILDMSDKSNIVFEYCLKENDEKEFAFPRAYFFPSFIANLCTANGIDGIKYKSTISDGYCYVFFDLHSDSFEAFEIVW